MNEGCQLLLGQKDFTSFTVTKSKKENMYMDINRCQFRETEDEIIFEIEADRFLHKCVRIIIGTFVLLGRKKLEVADIQQILLAKDRRIAGSTAPPNGRSGGQRPALPPPPQVGPLAGGAGESLLDTSGRHCVGFSTSGERSQDREVV